jgi:hypothetical protein
MFVNLSVFAPLRQNLLIQNIPMKTTIILIALITILFSSCGPAAEKRERMDYIAKRTSDSIQLFLDSALQDPINELSKTQAWMIR